MDYQVIGAVAVVLVCATWVVCFVASLAAASPTCAGCCNCDTSDTEDSELAFLDDGLSDLLDEIDGDLADPATYDDATYRALLKSYRDTVSRLLGDDDNESEVA